MTLSTTEPAKLQIQLTQLPPLSLYVHIPWCVRKCPYCDFNSHPIQEILPETRYVEAMLRDLEADLPKVWGRKIRSIFIGGGTPSTFSAAALDTLLAGIRARLPVLPQAEITLEANPGTVENSQFTAFRDLGINRLSLGIQSFADAALQKLGRIHDRHTAVQAIMAAQAAGFAQVNVDLMFGLPQQTLEQALQDLQTAIDLAPTHISWYQLTIEPNTVFFQQPPPNLPDDDQLWDMQSTGRTLLAKYAYEHYEISAYARAQQYCQHNLNYWQFGDYLGIGAGAHSKLSDAAHNHIYRFAKIKHPRRYMDGLQVTLPDNQAVMTEQRVLQPDEIGLEFMLNALRLRTGFNAKQFIAHTGLPLEQVKAPLTTACERGWLMQTDMREDTHFFPTEMGQRFLNDLLELFVPAA